MGYYMINSLEGGDVNVKANLSQFQLRSYSVYKYAARGKHFAFLFGCEA